MLKKIGITLISILSLGFSASAQKPCATDTKYWEMVKKYPGILDLEKQFEDQIGSNIEKTAAGAAARTTAISASDTTIFDIPMVVHIVHDYSVENLSDDVIYEAAQYWATVYMCQNTDTSGVINPFKKWVGNPRMRLHLATIDPNGKPTKGVVRHMSYLTTVADDGAKFDPWPQNKYVNIWVIRTFGASATGAAAYAYLPGMAAYQPYYDGVIVLYDYANYAKTVPHEIGHVLNLQHPWGNTNNPAVACGDDHVDDTPPTKGHNPVGCVASALYDTACATGYLKHYRTASGGDSLVDYPDTANSQNIMDYTYCQEMFTKGQCFRMRTALTSTTAGRNNLITAANLSATGALAPMPDLPPVADYIMNRGTGGSFVSDDRSYFLTLNNSNSFLFRNTSWNDTLSDVQWTFSNGASTPSVSSLTTVINRFTVPGYVTVTEVAISNAGSDTLVNTQAVYVADTAGVSPWGYVQNFDPANCGNWPMFNYYRNNFKWDFYSGASADGDGKCMRYRSFDTTDKTVGTALGDHDDLFTPGFNLAGITGNYYLNFYTSGCRIPGSGTTDSMEIDASTNGGAQWTRIGGASGTSLINNTYSSLEFVPTSASQWVAHAINIPTAYRTANTFFRFRYWPGDIGNNCYLDNFYTYQFPAEVLAPTAAAGSLKLSPNPATNGCNILFKTGYDGSATIMVKDITGRVVYQLHNSYAPDAIAEETIDRSVTPVAGIYLVTVIINGKASTEKLVVY